MMVLSKWLHLMTWGGRREVKVITHQLGMVLLWDCQLEKLWTMEPDVGIADFVQWPRQKENKLQSMTAEKITQGLQSLWKVPLPVNCGTKHHYRTQDTPYTLGM